jgi:hypothetical protein
MAKIIPFMLGLILGFTGVRLLTHVFYILTIVALLICTCSKVHQSLADVKCIPDISVNSNK